MADEKFGGCGDLRLRRKPWIDQAILEYKDLVYLEAEEIAAAAKLGWQEAFGRPAPLYVELGTGKGRFISRMAQRHPAVHFIGIEAQRDIVYYAAKNVRDLALENVRLLRCDISGIEEIFQPGEVDAFFINFCDPWPKARHAKRRLTHARFLARYRKLLRAGGKLYFKTDNRPLFDFSLEQFAQEGRKVEKLTFDLHAEEMADNIMTEYEEKFSGLGEKINRCEVSFD